MKKMTDQEIIDREIKKAKHESVLKWFYYFIGGLMMGFVIVYGHDTFKMGEAVFESMPVEIENPKDLFAIGFVMGSIFTGAFLGGAHMFGLGIGLHLFKNHARALLFKYHSKLNSN